MGVCGLSFFFFFCQQEMKISKSKPHETLIPPCLYHWMLKWWTAFLIVCFLGGSWHQHFASVCAHFPGSHTPIWIRRTTYFCHLGPCRTPQGGQVILHFRPLFRSRLYIDTSHCVWQEVSSEIAQKYFMTFQMHLSQCGDGIFYHNVTYQLVYWNEDNKCCLLSRGRSYSTWIMLTSSEHQCHP